MRKVKQTAIGPELDALVERAHLSEADRQKVRDAMHTAEQLAGAVLWVREKATAIGTWFLKPSMKH
jgi:hypothetical protein